MMMTANDSSSAKATFSISGMTCAGCVARLERVLRQQSGVVSASVNLQSERVDLAYDPARTAVADLIGAVESAGFRVRLAGETSAGDSSEDARRILITLAVSVALT